MMSISEQIKELRELADDMEKYVGLMPKPHILRESDNTIESLSAKLQAANMERTAGDSGEMNKSILEVKTPKNCHECELCYEYRLCFVKTHDSGCCCGGRIMEEVPESGKPNWCPLKESAADCGGWIPCKDRLPDVEVSENVKTGICSDNGERFLITDTEGYVYESTFWLSTQEFEDDAIAWMPKPEPYHEP